MAYENLPRLPDPTTTPVGPGFTALGYTDNSAGLMHVLNTGGSVGVQYSGSYWTINISYPELTLQEASSFLAFLGTLGGGFKNFYVQLPMFVNPATGAWDTSTATKIAQGELNMGASDREIVITNWSSRGGDISSGDMLKLTNSNKIYRVAKTSLLSNTMTLELNCPLLEPAKLATAGLEPNNIKFRVRLEGGFPEVKFTNRGLYDPFSIQLRENIR